MTENSKEIMGNKKEDFTHQNNKPTLMVSSLPHTQLDKRYVSCAYSMKALKFAKMMLTLGYKVITFGSEDTEIEHPNYTHVNCMSKKEQEKFYGDPNSFKRTFYNITWSPEDEHWKLFNSRIVEFINNYSADNPDEEIIFGHFAGWCQKQVAANIGNIRSIELGIGYTGVYGRFNVYESYAHMHYVHGEKRDDNGNFYDTVIPNYYDPREFPFSKKLGDDKGEYFLFVGRLIDRKGYRIAQEVCEKLGKRLILAGQLGDEGFSGYGEHIGTIGVKERGELMSKATALFVPTTYLGPFEGVHAEALMCGTPVITTNFGVFTETVENDFNGQRCDVFRDFLNAVTWSESLDNKHRKKIRKAAQDRFAMKNVAKQYDAYIKRINDLNGKGWYAD